MRKSWQVKVLLFFIALFVLTNIESFFIGTIEFIVRIPLNINSFMTNVAGIEAWSKIVMTTSHPAFLICFGLFLCILTIGLIRSFESFKSR